MPISPYAKLETKPPTQTNDSQFQLSQFVKCNFFDLVAATPDAMVDFLLRSPIVCRNAKASNSYVKNKTPFPQVPDAQV